jgi:caffeoyl-CoA O-methyltransferase
MEPIFTKGIELYTHEHTSPVPPLLEELERETRERVPNSQMLTGRVEGTLLQMLVRISGARRVVDIGTYTGYSALMMAGGLPEGGELITCEVSEAHADIARRYFKRSPHGGKIRLALGPALATLSGLRDESVDFVFIDADKASYPAYYDESMRILRRGGLIAVDNVLWSGRVLAPTGEDADQDTRAIIAFNDRVRADERVEKVMLTVRDGVYLIRKSL